MTDHVAQLVKELIAIANSDYAEPDPTTGEIYEPSGLVIVSAAAELERLQADLRNAEGACMRWKKELTYLKRRSGA